MAKVNQFEDATRRGRKLRASGPVIVAASYDPQRRRIVLKLRPDLEVSFSPKDAEGLERAKPSQLERIEISPSGFGLHFPALDADLYIPAILEGILGSRKWMASRLGQAGGRSTSRAKQAASKANGRLGGRPRKATGARSSR
ncbi:MAG TPA: DUF2442 domain-containing protein [Candidatus Limnocylindrales bacterium]|nr:DUF2442 domain-containing protein [Candidatus Limnocylindrales bacterium]